MNDRLICTSCRGEKILRTHVNNLVKVDICPSCKGTGSMVSENDWRKNSSKKLIKG